ncbi:MAG TPA: hypothetical protein H9730_05860 [Candidatus Mediterraneibacter stercoripullorum]|nr:hypothetical protein [Candidatus Mediterraneibacter stercoripullorum]
MNDALYEQLIARRPKPYDLPLRILIIFVIVAVAVFGTPFLGFLSFFIAVILAILAYYFVFPKLNVEFEYILLNHDLQIDAIYNKAKRKKKLNIDIQGAEIIAPKKSPRMNSYKPEKTMDFSSGNPNAKTYAIMISMNQNNTCIYFDPDEKMIDHMKQWMGMKMFTD